MELNNTEREIVAWLRDADDQCAEDLCDALFAEMRKQRSSGRYTGQPFFDLFATAIESGSHRKEG